MMGFFNDAERAALRDFAESYLRSAECTIERYPDSVLNTATARREAQIPQHVYTGRCQVKPTRGPREIVLGEELVAYQDTTVIIPHDAPLPQRGDVITVTSSDDALMLGRTFAVLDVEMHTENITRTLACQTLQRQS